MTQQPLSQRDFLVLFAEYFGLDGPLTGNETLAADLGFDSVAMMEALLLVEEACASTLPTEAAGDIQDLDDLYHYYVKAFVS